MWCGQRGQIGMPPVRTKLGNHGSDFAAICWRVFAMCQIGGGDCFGCKTAILGGIGQGGQNVRTAPCPTVRTGPDRAGQGPDRAGQGPDRVRTGPCPDLVCPLSGLSGPCPILPTLFGWFPLVGGLIVGLDAPTFNTRCMDIDHRGENIRLFLNFFFQGAIPICPLWPHHKTGTTPGNRVKFSTTGRHK